MYDQILKLVKEHLGEDPQVAAAIPADKADAVHTEIANQLTSGISTQASEQGGIGGLISMIQGGLAGGNPLTGGIAGSLVSTLASKFGLSPAVTGAIAGALPGLLKKFAHKAADPNDPSITSDSITESISKLGKGGLGGLFN